MSVRGRKSNVHPDHYKVAGRERQGEDILQEEHKQRYRQYEASLRMKRRGPLEPPPVETPPEEPETTQVSSKKGKRSSAQKESATRHAYEPAPAAKRTAGAHGKKVKKRGK